MTQKSRDNLPLAGSMLVPLPRKVHFELPQILDNRDALGARTERVVHLEEYTSRTVRVGFEMVAWSPLPRQYLRRMIMYNLVPTPQG